MTTPGICLTFDDFHVETRRAARPVCQAHHARVTFCLCWSHAATPAQIDNLHRLQADGHEIACRGRTRKTRRPDLRRYGLDLWPENQIARGVSEHRAPGVPATRRARPFQCSTRQTRAATAPCLLVTRTDQEAPQCSPASR
ncbi:polysaccharide deacetylase family protein [Roseovarius atlanticus]|uniref:polysaccharide deacetylase family protein n=1 Tax=Roseovarius atlanticus TaxID=1641875 RepID=UPI001C97AFF8|nr:polysaccharide deacetylase family protein [Roseovarius atlanticus]MBY5986963.1 polysaccharide deacetylase family protein [Roseovarius atlanticus]MBY6125603.1 polysaccharide deacetylase family protein [Roseovarius atlanticus]MBY6149936.1 polysaccharide deacetylase family protein [Roseovarius atlanticus]